MTYNPRTYMQDLADEANRIVLKLGAGWSHVGAIITHDPSGAKVLLMTQVAVAPNNALRINLEGMTEDEIVEAARKVAPTTYWLTEYGSEEGGWAPTRYDRHASFELAQAYAADVIAYVDGDIRISQVTAQIVKVMTK